MRFFTCGNGSRPSTTNLLKREENKYESESDCKRNCEGIDVRGVCHSVLQRIWLCGHAPVELADAGPVWLAFDHLLAGVGYPDSQQNSLRGISRRPAGAWHALARPHARTLGADDSRRAGEFPSVDARTLWTVCTPASRRAQSLRTRMNRKFGREEIG